MSQSTFGGMPPSWKSLSHYPILFISYDTRLYHMVHTVPFWKYVTIRPWYMTLSWHHGHILCIMWYGPHIIRFGIIYLVSHDAGKLQKDCLFIKKFLTLFSLPFLTICWRKDFADFTPCEERFCWFYDKNNNLNEKSSMMWTCGKLYHVL